MLPGIPTWASAKIGEACKANAIARTEVYQATFNNDSYLSLCQICNLFAVHFDTSFLPAMRSG